MNKLYAMEHSKINRLQDAIFRVYCQSSSWLISTRIGMTDGHLALCWNIASRVFVQIGNNSERKMRKLYKLCFYVIMQST